MNSLNVYTKAQNPSIHIFIRTRRGALHVLCFFSLDLIVFQFRKT